MEEICQCHGACFLEVGGNTSSVRETITNISREDAGHVRVSWCLRSKCGWENFVDTGDNYENILRTCGKCANVMVPAFWLRVRKMRECGKQ
jgi:hypothetical protein